MIGKTILLTLHPRAGGAIRLHLVAVEDVIAVENVEAREGDGWRRAHPLHWQWAEAWIVRHQARLHDMVRRGFCGGECAA